MFRVEVYGRKPTIEDLLGEKFWIGPVSYGGMTHQEFMTMSTPKELQPYAGFTGKYHDLAHNISTAKIKTRIWFCITFCLCLSYHFCKWFCAIVIVENKIERT